MTRKDYEKFARMLKAATPRYSTLYSGQPVNNVGEHVFKEKIQYHADMIQSIAAIFANDNPNFNKQKFINAILTGS